MGVGEPIALIRCFPTEALHCSAALVGRPSLIRAFPRWHPSVAGRRPSMRSCNRMRCAAYQNQRVVPRLTSRNRGTNNNSGAALFVVTVSLFVTPQESISDQKRPPGSPTASTALIFRPQPAPTPPPSLLTGTPRPPPLASPPPHPSTRKPAPCRSSRR